MKFLLHGERKIFQTNQKRLAVVAEETIPLNVKGVGPSLKVGSALEALVVASQADPSLLLGPIPQHESTQKISARLLMVTGIQGFKNSIHRLCKAKHLV